MAIAIEDDFTDDPRFHALARKIGNADTAMGMVYRLWKLGQKYWGKNGKSKIPLNIFSLAELDIMFEVQLAEKHDDGVYVKGSQSRFNWLHSKVEAGKKSAEKRRQKDGTAQPKGRWPTSEQPPNGSERCSENSEQPPNGSEPITIAITSKDITHTEGDISNSCVGNKSGEISPLKKLELASTQGATDVIAAMHQIGKDALAAQNRLGPYIWAILERKYPVNTWVQLVDEYENSFKRGAESFFLKDLKAHFEAFIPIVAKNELQEEKSIASQNHPTKRHRPHY